MYDYYAVPNEYNGFKTLHGYWMEDTHGRIGIDVEVFGPYRMAAKSFEYGMATDFNGAVATRQTRVAPRATRATGTSATTASPPGRPRRAARASRAAASTTAST